MASHISGSSVPYVSSSTISKQLYVQKYPSHTLEKPKMNTEARISKITHASRHLIASNIEKRVNAVITESGGNFQHFL